MSSTATLYVTSLAWNGVTWQAAAGEALRLEYRHGGEELAEAPPGSRYPTFVALLRSGCRVRATVPEAKPGLTVGAKSDLVAVLKTRGAPLSLTLKNLVLLSVAGVQDRDQAAACVLTFAHENVDGATPPVV